MKIIHRQAPPEPDKKAKKSKVPVLVAVMAAALVAGIGLIAVLDNLTAPETTDPDDLAEVNITTTQPTKPTTTTTATTATTAKTTTTQTEKTLYVLPLSNNVLTEYSEAPVWNETMQSYRTHQAVDFAGKLGDKLVAAATGTVKAVYDDALWGGCLELDCGYGILIRYCGIKTTCTAGQEVTVNQTIGTLAEVPCEAYLEPHLHLEVTVDGDPIDALKAIDQVA